MSNWQAPEGALPHYLGEPPTLLEAFECKWNPFLNSVNTIFNLACQTGKRRRCSLSLLGSGAEPQPPTLLRAFGCKWNPFLNSVNTIFNYFGAYCGPAACGPILIVPFGNSRLAATVNDTGACRLTPIGGIGHVHQNVRLYVLLLHRGSKLYRGAKTVG